MRRRSKIILGTVGFAAASGALLLWQAPALVRLPFGQATYLPRRPELEVWIDARLAPHVPVFGSFAPADRWPETLVLVLPRAGGGDDKIVILSAESAIGQPNNRPEDWQNLDIALIRSDAAGFVDLYGVKGYEGEPDFKKSPAYLSFCLPMQFPDYPGSQVEIRRKN